jgi:NarL family two-component system response regulator LiaR
VPSLAQSIPLRVLIVDQDPLVRRILRDELAAGGLSVVAEASDGREAVQLAFQHQPDLVLMDIVLPEFDGPQTIRRIVTESPLVRVVVLARSEDAEAGITGLKAGASGFLTKDIELKTLPRVLAAVHAGEAAISRQFASLVIDRLRAAPEGGTGLRPVRSVLTPREWEVLDLLSTSLTVDEVADALVLSAETIRSHLKRAMRKLGVSRREEAFEAMHRLRGSAAGLGPGGVAQAKAA